MYSIKLRAFSFSLISLDHLEKDILSVYYTWRNWGSQKVSFYEVLKCGSQDIWLLQSFFFPPELTQFLFQELFFSFFPILHGKTCLPTFFQTALASPHNGEAPIEGAGQNLLEQGKRVIVAVFCAWEQGKQKNRLRTTAFMWEQIGQLSNEGRPVIFVTNFSIPILANQFFLGLRELKPFKNNGKKFPGLRRAFCLPPYCP